MMSVTLEQAVEQVTSTTTVLKLPRLIPVLDEPVFANPTVVKNGKSWEFDLMVGMAKIGTMKAEKIGGKMQIAILLEGQP